MTGGQTLRVLGIDPGSVCTGYGVLEEPGAGGDISVVASGVIRAPRGTLTDRLTRIYAGLQEVFGSHRPDAVAVEEVFQAKNTKSALVLGHARGVALLAAGVAGLSVHEYPTRKVKQTVTGHGNADKEQVRRVLGMILGELPAQLDASDALAVALCHLRCADFPEEDAS
jgi:crossover junction endodeoxyribonuclease RuvC